MNDYKDFFKIKLKTTKSLLIGIRVNLPFQKESLFGGTVFLQLFTTKKNFILFAKAF